MNFELLFKILFYDWWKLKIYLRLIEKNVVNTSNMRIKATSHFLVRFIEDF